ncbi:MAG: polysaccharide lyase 8 family protein [Bacteroidales bacterium]
MKKDNFLLLAVIVLFLTSCTALQPKYPEDLKQLHQNIWTNIMDEPADLHEVNSLLSELKEDGSWADIDYTSKERGGWPPRNHISRLLEISKAYQTKGTQFYHKKDISEKIHSGLNFWFENDFICPNWWYPEIGVPMVLAPTMILMEAELSPEQMEKGIIILNRSKIGMTGQNKVWQSGNVLLRNLLLKNADTIRIASESIKEELVVGTGEGVQSDWSYHQHGPQLQFGNYGLAYVGDMIKWISILRQTPFQFDESKMAILRNYLLEGQQWVTWKNEYDISACGRQLFPDSPKQKAESLSLFFTKMEKLDAEHSGEYEKANDYRNLSGSKHFWRSDFQVYRTPDYYFSIKMCSDRVIGAESCNSENVQGYYMGDGATFLYQTTEEYRNIFPFWDWKKIPGTTIQQDSDTLPILTARGYRIESNFVGGVSDSKNGIAVMDYNRNGLTAHKSWFMFNDMIVCLGSGINSFENLTVTTSINQSFYKSEPEFQKTGRAGGLFSWILHDNIGYFFPNGSEVKYTTNDETGAWNWVANRYPEEILHARIFKLWLEHGSNPKNKSYQYVLVPNATKEKLEGLVINDPFKIRNENSIQEVVANSGDIAGIIFYKAGKSNILAGIEVDQPCVVMIKKLNDELKVAVADPTQLLKEISLTISGNYSVENSEVVNGKTKLKITLPQNEEAGKTVSIILNRNN